MAATHPIIPEVAVRPARMAIGPIRKVTTTTKMMTVTTRRRRSDDSAGKTGTRITKTTTDVVVDRPWTIRRVDYRRKNTSKPPIQSSSSGIERWNLLKLTWWFRPECRLDVLAPEEMFYKAPLGKTIQTIPTIFQSSWKPNQKALH